MKIDGIWKVEMLGAYGWEPMSTAFLQDGRYWAGSAEHYTIGSYSADGDKVTADTKTMLHGGGTRTLFGKQASHHEVRFEGNMSGDRIKGLATDSEGVFLVRFRATRVADLP